MSLKYLLSGPLRTIFISVLNGHLYLNFPIQDCTMDENLIPKSSQTVNSWKLEIMPCFSQAPRTVSDWQTTQIQIHVIVFSPVVLGLVLGRHLRKVCMGSSGGVMNRVYCIKYCNGIQSIPFC